MDFLKKLSDSVGDFTKTQVFKFIVVGLVVFILAVSAFLIYLNSADSGKYPKLEAKLYREVEQNFLEIVESAKDDPYQAIEALENQPPVPKDLENRKKFILAKLYDSIGESVMAFIRISEVENTYIPQYSIYFRVKLAERVGHEASVVKDLEFLKAKYPNNQKYNYELAKSYLRQSLKDDAKKIFLAIKKNNPDSEYAIAANYYLAGMATDKKEQLPLLKEYLIKSPTGSLSYLITDQILTMDKADQAFFKTVSNHMAISYCKIGEYEKAIELFNTALDGPELYLKPFVEALTKLGKEKDAAALILRSLPKISNPEFQREMLDLYLKSIPTKEEAIFQLTNLKDVILTEAQDKVYWEIAVRTDEKQDYLYVYENYPRSDYAAESLKRVFWKEFQRENYHKAIDLYRDHWKEYEGARSHAFVAFWAAKIHLKLGEKENARSVLQNLIISHPDDYYGFRANQILDKKNKWYLLPGANEFIAPAIWNWPKVYENFDIEKLFGADILEMTKAGQYKYILDLADAGEIKIDDDFKMWLFAKNRNFLEALTLASNGIAANHMTADPKNFKFIFAYPLIYEDLITDETSKSLKVDPMLVHALMRQESSYQNTIVSPAGAVGLMQVMPYTAKDLAKSLEIDPPTKPEDLMDPELNIKFGVQYLENVLRKYDNNLICSIASYNAGPLPVTKWLEKFKELPQEEQDFDLFLEKIPYDETKEYTKRVLNNYWIYKQLYN